MLHYLAKLFYFRFFIFGVVVFSLTACSSNKVNQPKPLDPSFKNQILIERLWKRSVGEGDIGLKLNLSSFIVNGTVYNIDGLGLLTALDAKTGKILWEKDLNDKVSGGLGGDEALLYYTSFQGELIALKRENGQELWRSNLSSESIAKPSSNGDLVAVQTVDGKLMVFNTDNGRLKWRYDSIGPLLSLRGTPSPIISQRYTLTSFANGELLAFDNQTGQPYWKATLATPQGRTELERLVDPDGQAVIDGDTLYTVSYQGNLVALDILTGQEKWAKSFSSFNSVAFGFGKLFVTTAEGLVFALNPTNGSQIWSNEAFKYRRLTSPFVYDQTIVFSDLEGYLHFLDISNGKQVAIKQPSDESIMGELNIVDSSLLVLTRSGNLVAYKLFSAQERLERSINKKLAR